MNPGPGFTEAIAAALRGVLHETDGAEVDVRLQIFDGGDWAVRWGSSDYDQDHRGYWGASCIDAESNLDAVAKELIAQVMDHMSDAQPLERSKVQS